MDLRKTELGRGADRGKKKGEVGLLEERKTKLGGGGVNPISNAWDCFFFGGGDLGGEKTGREIPNRQG